MHEGAVDKTVCWVYVSILMSSDMISAAIVQRTFWSILPTNFNEFLRIIVISPAIYDYLVSIDANDDKSLMK